MTRRHQPDQEELALRHRVADTVLANLGAAMWFTGGVLLVAYLPGLLMRWGVTVPVRFVLGAP